MENRKNIDDLFKEQLGDYTETPPPAAWSALENKLRKTPSAAGAANRRTMYAVIAGCLLLLLSVSVTRNMNLFHAGNNEAAPGLATAPLAQNINGKAGAEGHKTIAATDNNAPLNGTAENADNSNTDNTTTENKDITTDNNNKTGNNDNTTANNINITGSSTSANNQKPNTNTNNIKERNTTTAARHGQNKHAAVSSGKKSHTKTYFTSKATRNVKEHTGLENERMPENVYNGSISKPAAANETAETTTGNTDEEEQNNKKDKQDKKEKDISPNHDKKEPTPIKPKQPAIKFPRFEAGVKAGYERGFNNDAGRKIVAGPYVQYNISGKFSLLSQPSVKASQVDARQIGSSKTYYKANNDSAITPNDAPVPVYLPGNTNPVFYIQHFTYSQSHDSIVKTNTVGGTYFEFEIPLLLKYRVTNSFSVYGGLDIVYSKLMTVKENTFKTTILRTAQDTAIISPDLVHSNLPPVNAVITHSGTPYSSYTGPDYTGTAGSPWRLGYMVGFSCDLSKRFLFDGLVQQADTKANYKAGYNINTTLSAPYFRFTLGYKLIR
jgi:hypothetical protein